MELRDRLEREASINFATGALCFALHSEAWGWLLMTLAAINAVLGLLLAWRTR